MEESPTVTVDEAAIRKAAEKAAILEKADRKARATLRKAAQAEEANFQKEIKPIQQVENATKAKALVRETINSFLQKSSKNSPT